LVAKKLMLLLQIQHATKMMLALSDLDLQIILVEMLSLIALTSRLELSIFETSN
jgi:hypothetical protein